MPYYLLNLVTTTKKSVPWKDGAPTSSTQWLHITEVDRGLYYYCDAVTSLLTNGSAAFKWKLHCHWLISLWQHQIIVQSSAVITRSHMSRYYIQHCDNKGRTYHSQMTPHALPSQASYGASFVRILEETDHVITALHCGNIGPSDVDSSVMGRSPHDMFQYLSAP